MRVKIEGGGHCVEIDHSDASWTPEKTAELAEHTWKRTRVVEPRQQMGYGAQLIERALDTAVPGNGAYEVKPEPTQA